MQEQYNYEERLEELKSGQDITFKTVLEPFIYKSIENYINSNNEQINILDVGCGCGFLTMQITKRFPKTKVEGIDMSVAAIKCAQKFSDLKFYKDDITKFNSKENFNILVYNMVFHNLQDIESAMQKNNQILKENGIVVITIPHPTFWLQDKINRGKISLDETFNYSEEKNYSIPFKIKNGKYHQKKLTYYHRKLSTYVDTFSKYFTIISFEETDYKNGIPTMLNVVLRK